MKLPSDVNMLLSFINTRLRDVYSDLDDLCGDLDIEKDALCEKMSRAGYVYHAEKHAFTGANE